ncbi:MAG: thiamine pyrophosphate-dependent enzyme [Candidatus Omnitrophica bacterium]|nr:thiamine pyrophosphate-dependent enzyme [Candidatus Omnitrophota bacterium]
MSLIFHSTYNKPILLIGNGLRTAGAVDMVHKFVRKTNIPVLTTMNGVDLAQDDLHIGFIGTHGNRVANMILNQCDLVVSIGARLGIRQVGRDSKNFAPRADLVRCDIDEYELSRNIKDNEKKYHADARDFIRMLLEEDVRDYTSWKLQCLQSKKLLEDYDIQLGNLAIKKISSLLPDNPIIAVDVGMNQCWAAQSFHLKGDNGRIHIGGGYGAMGCALPYAIGSSISINNGIVYCICGDGGFQMNIQELETVKRENLPIKIFILNNKVLGKISETQHFYHDDRFANTALSGGYTVPEFSKIAEAYGIRAVKLNNYEELDNYKEWFYDDNPCLFDIPLPEESFLTPKIKFETGMISPKLDDKVFIKVKEILKK